MKIFFRILLSTTLLLAVAVLGIWIDGTIFSGRIGLSKSSLDLLKNLQRSASEEIGAEYMDLIQGQEKFLLSFLGGASFSGKVSIPGDDRVISGLCKDQICSFTTRDRYILLYYPGHAKGLFDIVKAHFGYVVALNDRWYVLAPCSRFSCSENDLH